MTMRRVCAVVGFVVAGVLAATPASAQGGYTQAIGGMTSGAQQRAFAGALAGATFGAIDINVEGGYMQDVLPKGLLDELNEFQEVLSDVFSNVQAQNRPLASFGGGVRFDIGTHSLLDAGYRYTTIFTDYDAPLLGKTDIKASVHTF